MASKVIAPARPMQRSNLGDSVVPNGTHCLPRLVCFYRIRCQRYTALAERANELCGMYCVRFAQQRPRASTALEELPREEERAPAQQPFQPFLQQDPPQSFGSSMVQSMTWGEFV